MDLHKKTLCAIINDYKLITHSSNDAIHLDTIHIFLKNKLLHSLFKNKSLIIHYQLVLVKSSSEEKGHTFIFRVDKKGAKKQRTYCSSASAADAANTSIASWILLRSASGASRRWRSSAVSIPSRSIPVTLPAKSGCSL